MNILCHSGMPVSRLAADIGRYPQVLINVPGPHAKADKEAILKSDALQAAMAEGNRLLAGDGRILVRPSGTEALIRVMVEASSEELAQKVARGIADTVENLQK